MVNPCEPGFRILIVNIRLNVMNVDRHSVNDGTAGDTVSTERYAGAECDRRLFSENARHAFESAIDDAPDCDIVSRAETAGRAGRILRAEWRRRRKCARRPGVRPARSLTSKDRSGDRSAAAPNKPISVVRHSIGR